MLGVDEPSIPAEAAGADWRPFVLLRAFWRSRVSMNSGIGVMRDDSLYSRLTTTIRIISIEYGHKLQQWHINQDDADLQHSVGCRYESWVLASNCASPLSDIYMKSIVEHKHTGFKSRSEPPYQYTLKNPPSTYTHSARVPVTLPRYTISLQLLFTNSASSHWRQ